MVLVSGGTGLVGSHLLYKLVSEGKKIKAIKRSSSNLNNVLKVFNYYCDNAKELFKKIQWYELDILDADGVNDCMDGVKQIYHSAAIVSFNPKNKEEMIRNNVLGTANMVNAALYNKIEKFCHVSSIAALGSSDNIVSEETFRKPGSEYSGYSISKYRSELEVWRGITEGLNAVIVNPSIILGAGNWQSGSASMFYKVWKGLKFYTKGSGGYVDVLDVVKIMMLLMKSDIKNERFIISAENLEYREVFNKIADNLEVKKPSVFVNKLMLSLAWRFEFILSKMINRNPLITKEIAASAQSISSYSNKKVVDVLDYKFLSIDESIKRTSKLFKKDFNC